MSIRPMRLLRASCHRLTAIGFGTVLAVAAVLVGAHPATAAPSTTVNCPTTSLQAAIDNAAPGATLTVTGTCAGNFVISKDLTLVGRGTAVLDGQRTGGTLMVPSGTVNVENLTITNGSSFNPTLATAGGGISNEGTLTLVNSVVSGNTGFVGGIVNQGSLTLEGTTVSDNFGAVVGGGIDNLGAATLGQSTVTGNSTSGFAGIGGGGGGIFNAGPLTLNDTNVSGNKALNGGGIDNSGDATLNNSIVSDNTASRGGGIDDDEGTLTLNDTAVRNNTATTDGGGITLEVFGAFGSVQLNDSTVTSNVPNNCIPAGSVAGCSG